MAYSSNVWVHKVRVDNWAMNKKIKETQRQVLIISTTGAYRTSPLQALCVISNNQLIHIKLKEIKELGEIAREQVNETKEQIRTRSLERWQLEWTSAETGRKTFDLLPSISERQEQKSRT